MKKDGKKEEQIQEFAENDALHTARELFAQGKKKQDVREQTAKERRSADGKRDVFVRFAK